MNRIQRALLGGGPGSGRYPKGSHQNIGDLLQRQIARNHAGAVAYYNSLPNTEGGRVLNTDEARELSKAYRKDRTRSAEVHEPASQFIKDLYAEKLAAPTPAGFKNTVLFTAGGTGAGKSSALRADPSGDAKSAEMIYDTNMNNVPSAQSKIEQALAAGRNVTVAYTYRDPVEALTGGALPRAMRMGRTVPLKEHLRTHVGSRNTVEALQKTYASNPRVAFTIIDNSHGPKGARVVDSVDKLPKINENGLEGRLHNALSDEHRTRRISDAVYHGTLGTRKVVGSGGRVVSAKSEQTGRDRTATGRPEKAKVSAGGPGSGPRKGMGQYVLSDDARSTLLSKFPPKFPDTVAHHVTHAMSATDAPPAGKVKVVGYAADKSLEAAVVSVNGSTTRPDGKTYHVTLSMDKSAGRSAKESNGVIAKGWTPVKDGPELSTTPTLKMQAGGPGSGRYPKGSSGNGLGRKKTGRVFVSPNVQEGTDLDYAQAALKSDRQKNFESKLKEISQKVLGGRADVHPSIGVWADGAENSTELHTNSTDREARRYAGAVASKMADQKAFLDWENDPSGPHTLHRVVAPESADKLNSKLGKAGIEFRTIQASPDGKSSMAYVLDQDGSLGDKVHAMAKENGYHESKAKGTGEFVGSWDSREEGRQEYDKIINAYESKHAGNPDRLFMDRGSLSGSAAGSTVRAKAERLRPATKGANLRWQSPRQPPEAKIKLARRMQPGEYMVCSATPGVMGIVTKHYTLAIKNAQNRASRSSIMFVLDDLGELVDTYGG